MPCYECGGTGIIRKEVVGTGEKAGKGKHELCKGQGWEPCMNCKGGRSDCPKCKNGEVTVGCSGCRDKKTVVCQGCVPGDWHAFEVCARMLHVAGRYEEAGKFYTAALQRVTGVPVNQDPDFPERKRAIDLWLRQERERLEAGNVAADQGKPPPAR
jgi:hypothetical protein